jgi:hypothetical protein
VTKEANLGVVPKVLSVALAVPAGWMIFALLLPAAAHGAKVGWGVAADRAAELWERAVGGCVVAACVLGCGACAMLLINVT